MKHTYASVRCHAATLFFALISSLVSFAEPVGSITDVTATNGKSLAHHELTVGFLAMDGTTSVSLKIRPNAEIPFTGGRIWIYDEESGEILVSLDIPRSTVPTSISTPRFVVSDKLLDHVEVSYHFQAKEGRPHIFKIKKGELRKLAALPK